MRPAGPERRKFAAPEAVFGVGALHLAGQYGRNLGGSKAVVPDISRVDLEVIPAIPMLERNAEDLHPWPKGVLNAR